MPALHSFRAKDGFVVSHRVNRFAPRGWPRQKPRSTWRFTRDHRVAAPPLYARPPRGGSAALRETTAWRLRRFTRDHRVAAPPLYARPPRGGSAALRETTAWRLRRFTRDHRVAAPPLYARPPRGGSAALRETTAWRLRRFTRPDLQPSTLQRIQRTFDPNARLLHDVGVDLRGADIFMSEQILHRADVIAIFPRKSLRSTRLSAWTQSL